MRSALSPEYLALRAASFAADGLDSGVEDPVVRTSREQARLRATGLTTHQAAERLGIRESQVQQRLGVRTMYGIDADGEWRLPLFQFAARGLVRGMEQVLPALPHGLHPVAVVSWFNAPSLELERAGNGARTPLEWLRAGHDPSAVVDLAWDL